MAPATRRSGRARPSAPPSDLEIAVSAVRNSAPKAKARGAPKAKKTPAAAPATPPPADDVDPEPEAPAALAATTSDSMIDRKHQTLTEKVVSIYTTIAPRSVFLTDPEAATLLTTPATSIELVSLLSGPSLLFFLD